VPRSANCRARIDRLQLGARLSSQVAPPQTPDFTAVSDRFVRSQTSAHTYGRVREYRNPFTSTRIFCQYQPGLPGLSPFKITVIPDDRRELSREELLQIVRPFSNYRLLLIEIALDFAPESGVDLDFVSQSGVFGKSRKNASRLYPLRALYGSRKGSKLARCYWKGEVNSFRVELELHSAWLRRYGISKLKDLRKLPNLLSPSHIKFVHMDWKGLRKYLSNRGLHATDIIQEARDKSDSIHEVMKFLRSSAGVNNAHRFLVTEHTNKNIQESLEKWARDF
jgi:hypothetical protein